MKNLLSSVETLDELRGEIKTPEEAVCAGMIIGEDCVNIKRDKKPEYVCMDIINDVLDMAIGFDKQMIDILNKPGIDTPKCIKEVMKGRSLEESMNDLIIFGLVIVSIREVQNPGASSGKTVYDGIADLFVNHEDNLEQLLSSGDKNTKLIFVSLGVEISKNIIDTTFPPILMAAFVKAVELDGDKTQKKMMKMADENITDLDEIISRLDMGNAVENAASLIIFGFIFHKNKN